MFFFKKKNLYNPPYNPFASHLWHPCSQMKDYETFPLISIKKANKSHFITADNQKIIDAISSWWCKSLGHNHPQIKRALWQQTKKFEHVILANTINENIEKLSWKLCQLNPIFDKVFFASEGTTAVEIALKMSLQYHAQNTTNPKQKRHKVGYLAGAYHGESVFAFSVSDLDLYTKPFQELYPKNIKISGFPILSGKEDPHWSNWNKTNYWQGIEKQLERHKYQLAAIIVEPILQGAAGMQIHSPLFLKKLRNWTQKNNIHLICDEIMTGLGRTGKALAIDHAGIEPDFVCLMKNLTAGWIPLSCVLTSKKIYRGFYDTYQSGKGFMHSNTFTGNALGVAIALKVLEIYEKEKWFHYTAQNTHKLRSIFIEANQKTGLLKNIRSLGYMAAADLNEVPLKVVPQRWGYRVYQRAIALGVWLRPLGNTLYLLPPYNISERDLATIKEVLPKAILGSLEE